MQELHAIISGRVQLVMMRDFVQRKARWLGLTGWVKNLPNGTVEVVAQGERDKLERLLKKLHRGSMLSRVDSVVPEWRNCGTVHTSFQIVF